MSQNGMEDAQSLLIVFENLANALFRFGRFESRKIGLNRFESQQFGLDRFESRSNLGNPSKALEGFQTLVQTAFKLSSNQTSTDVVQ